MDKQDRVSAILGTLLTVGGVVILIYHFHTESGDPWWGVGVVMAVFGLGAILCFVWKKIVTKLTFLLRPCRVILLSLLSLLVVPIEKVMSTIGFSSRSTSGRSRRSSRSRSRGSDSATLKKFLK